MRSKQLEHYVKFLSQDIGERNYLKPEKLDQSIDFIHNTLSSFDLNVQNLSYQARNQTFTNIEATLKGDSDDIILIGAHYDSRVGTPGADDNASGVASLLVLAEELSKQKQKSNKTIRFVAFANEEQPFANTEDMGSLRYARFAKERGDHVSAALILEMLGYYSSKKGSQRIPGGLGLLYPSVGDFIAVVSNFENRKLVKKIANLIKPSFPVQQLSAPSFFPSIGRSDHWSFWQVGVPTLMITDTANFRTPHYHQSTDTWDTLDYPRMEKLTNAILSTIQKLSIFLP